MILAIAAAATIALACTKQHASAPSTNLDFAGVLVLVATICTQIHLHAR
jgi:hypothetical protein